MNPKGMMPDPVPPAQIFLCPGWEQFFLFIETNACRLGLVPKMDVSALPSPRESGEGVNNTAAAKEELS